MRVKLVIFSEVLSLGDSRADVPTELDCKRAGVSQTARKRDALISDIEGCTMIYRTF